MTPPNGPAVTAAEREQASALLDLLHADMLNIGDVEDAIATALAAVRAEERERCIAIVKTGAFVFQSDPPMAVTAERLEGLRAQIVRALTPGAGGTNG